MNDLHQRWGMGSGHLSAITAGKHFNFVGLATLTVAISFLDGVLLQKASSFIAQDSRSQVK